MDLVECVPNFSEGRRANVIRAITTAAAGPGVQVLDIHSDAAHNRSVVTLAGSADAVLEAAYRSVAIAAELIDLREHRGEHPRIGATDVVPFVPLGDTPMARCVSLARELGARIGSELHLPVYLYAEAANDPERRWLPTIRRGEYELLATTIASDPAHAPDFGPRVMGPAGAVAVGARPFLVAYNVNLATGDLAVATEIARAIRQSSGGLPAVQARAMRTSDADMTQVSMNLLDINVTPGHVVYAEVARLAAERGVRVVGAELVGLMPLSMATNAAGPALGVPGLRPGHTVEARLLSGLLEQFSSAPK